jgi:hypothetical protein
MEERKRRVANVHFGSNNGHWAASGLSWQLFDGTSSPTRQAAPTRLPCGMAERVASELRNLAVCDMAGVCWPEFGREAGGDCVEARRCKECKSLSAAEEHPRSASTRKCRPAASGTRSDNPSTRARACRRWCSPAKQGRSSSGQRCEMTISCSTPAAGPVLPAWPRTTSTTLPMIPSHPPPGWTSQCPRNPSEHRARKHHPRTSSRRSSGPNTLRSSSRSSRFLPCTRRFWIERVCRH